MGVSTPSESRALAPLRLHADQEQKGDNRAMENKKRCTGCGLERELDEFYPRKDGGGGRRADCRLCVLGRQRARRAAGLTQAVDRRRYKTSEKYRAGVARHTTAWKLRNREKCRVHDAVAKAIARGELARKPCEVCGGRAHAHHEDYGRPLEVRWLCPWHHARQHMAEGRMPRKYA